MKFKPPSNSFTVRDYLFIAFVAILLAFVSFSLFSFNLKLKGGGEFYTHLTASRAFIFEKIDPYGAEIPARVQTLVYGRPARAGEKPYILDTPFHLVLLYFPFALFSDPLTARAVYTWLLQLTLIPLAIISLRLTDWQPPFLLGVFFAALCISNIYSIQAVYEASPVLILGLFYAGILLALRANMDEIAGALIAASFYRWEVGAPFLFLVALRAYREKRTGALYGFLMLTFIALAVSLLLYANWIIPFLRAVTNNLRADFGYNLRSVFAELFPAQGNLLAWVVIILLFIALVYEWSIARDADFRRFYWAACLSIAAAPLLGFRVEMANLAVLVVPLALIFAVAHDRWKRTAGHFLAALLMLFVFLIPWALSLFPFKFAKEATFLFLPVFTIIGLYWIRWWAIRPPRIWTDLAPPR
jgi:hypothetical protein